MIKEYSWSIGGFFKEDAAVVGNELEKIEEREELKPEAVVNYARENQDSALYRMLEWDDTIAGENWRKQQARIIITNIKVSIIHNDEEVTKTPIRAYVHTRRNEAYEPIEVVVRDTDKYQRLLEKAYKELNTVKIKYSELEEIQDLLKDIPSIK